jgi:uncharacterized OsmC-like protein
MTVNYQDRFIAAQAQLRDKPGDALQAFSALTHLTGGLCSEAQIRDFHLTTDKPSRLAGTELGEDAGPDPAELVLAALGSCQEATYRLYADTLGIPLRDVSVKVTGRIDLRGLFAAADGVRPGFRDIRAAVTIDSPASIEDIERLKAMVDRHSPVLDMLRNVTPVQTSLDLVNGAARPAAA